MVRTCSRLTSAFSVYHFCEVPLQKVEHIIGQCSSTSANETWWGGTLGRESWRKEITHSTLTSLRLLSNETAILLSNTSPGTLCLLLVWMTAFPWWSWRKQADLFHLFNYPQTRWDLHQPLSCPHYELKSTKSLFCLAEKHQDPPNAFQPWPAKTFERHVQSFPFFYDCWPIDKKNQHSWQTNGLSK